MNKSKSEIRLENIKPTCANCAKAPGFGDCAVKLEIGCCDDHEFVLTAQQLKDFPDNAYGEFTKENQRQEPQDDSETELKPGQIWKYKEKADMDILGVGGLLVLCGATNDGDVVWWIVRRFIRCDLGWMGAPQHELTEEEIRRNADYWGSLDNMLGNENTRPAPQADGGYRDLLRRVIQTGGFECALCPARITCDQHSNATKCWMLISQALDGQPQGDHFVDSNKKVSCVIVDEAVGDDIPGQEAAR